MRSSKATRRWAREAAGNPDLVVWYVPPGQPVVIGYAILPDVTENELPATDVQVTLLDDASITHTRVLKRSAKGEDLFWITVTNGNGPILYRWIAPDGIRHDFFAFGDDELETAAARQATADRGRRLQMLWKIVYRTGRSQEVANRVSRRVGNKLSTTLIVFKLVVALLAEHGNNEDAVREELEKLQNSGPMDRDTQLKIREAGANSTEPSVVSSILRGALLALERKD